jgi:hypothetical protein
MRDPNLPSFPPASALGSSFTLPNDISAVQIQSSTDSETRLSPMFKLPRGARVQPCGRGFNASTLRVFCEGQFYYVFEQELAAAS